MARHPAVADRFYPGNSTALTREVQNLIGTQPAHKQKAMAVICPHAGYIYSGGVAAETLRQVIVPETVIILGPNHHGQGAEIALSTTTWEMPMGNVPIDTELAEMLVHRSPLIRKDEVAHRFEHSLEVQVPFLQEMQKNLAIVPLVIAHIPYSMCEKVADNLSESIKESGKNVLILASSDMTHYESRSVAAKKDRLALDRLLALDPAGLYQTVVDRRITMCGFIPATIALLASMQLGARTANLVRYTDSGEVSGDTDQVVGYAGVIIS
jgi:MEMO1 family protein